MTEENTTPDSSASGAVSDGEGAGTDSSSSGPGNDGGVSDGKSKAVPLDVHKQTLNEFHDLKSKYRAAETKLDEALGTIEHLKTQSLREKEDYKSLYETEAQKRRETEEKLERQRTALFNSQRYNAVFPELKKAGLRDDAENLVGMHDWGDVEVDLTSNGRFDVRGIDSAVEAFKHSHPYAFDKPKAPRVNGSPGSGSVPSSGELTAQQVIAIENECRQKGDMKPYYEAYNRFKEQRRRQQTGR